MRRDAKADENQPAIVEALRAVGATVQHLHMIGQGCPDIVVGYQGSNYLLEIKSADGKLTYSEGEWHLDWQGQVAIVRTIDDALDAVGAYPF